MCAERDELLRLIHTIPDDEVRAILADVRKQRQPVPAGPAEWFGINDDEPSYWH